MNNSKSHNEHFEELCAAYVLNASDSDEKKEFEAMMQNADQEQKEIYLKFRSAANNLAQATEPVKPSESVENRLLEQIDEGSSQSAKTFLTGEKATERSSSRFRMAVAASIVLLLVSLAFIIYSITLHSQVHDQQAKITKLQNVVQKKQKMLAILGARTVDLVILKGQKVNPAGYGKLIWDPKKQQALLQVSNLPAVPNNKDYQLWLIKDGKPIPAGIFDINEASKNSFFAIQQLAKVNKQNANAFAITLEPKGGSSKPTGDMYLMGKI
jgi:anti-sigma-K factor RskA